MRNLRINRVQRCCLDIQHGKISGIVAVAHDDNASVPVLYYVRDGEFCMWREENGETVLSPETFTDVIAAPEYLSFERRIWFATKDTLVYYSWESEELTTVSLEKSAQCFAWNPTREVLVVVHEDAQLVTYSVDVLNGCAARLDCSSLHSAVPHSVYVGWGSADTQFRGSAGKLKKQNGATTEQQQQQPITDTIARVTWRGNGEMFAVNYWKDDRRTFKVFQQDCKPLYECCWGAHDDDDDGLLECVIAWRPEGNMIANAVLLQDNKHCVFIFEKNGHKRFSIPLVYDNYEVNDLKWSHRGEVLAVLQQHDRYLSLYTTSNYKWYLKQHLVFAEPLISFAWNAILDQFHTCTQQDFFTYDFQMAYDVCGDCVAVIDGKSVHLTRFRDSCLPPPLPQITIQSARGAAINSVVLIAGQQTQFAIIDCDWHVSIYNNDRMLSSYEIQSVADGGTTVFYNFHWLQEVLFCLAVSREAQIQLVSLGNDGKVFISKEQQSDIVDLKNVRNIQHLLEFNATIYQLRNEVVVVQNETNTTVLSDRSLIIKSVYCSSKENGTHVFSLTATNNFYVNEKCISKSVTSFIVLHNKYLLLTTAANNLLYCIHIGRLPSLKSDNDNDLSAHFFHRPIEQGAQLIAGVHDTSTVVLQIPRGNLEIVSCRPIAIDILERHLASNNWEEALHFLRTDRLNFNLLVDLNIDRFLKNIDKFVEACKTAAVLNMFIQEIEDSNVLETIYLQCYHQSSTTTKTNKRTAVCNALLSYFEEDDYANYAVSIVTLALYHFNIAMALTYIQDLYHRLPETTTPLANAIKTLIIHTKTEPDDFLFKKSLQLYDTNLTRHICSFTQMDPKFYLPLLAELDEFSEVKRRFHINQYLKKPELAVQYLIRDASVAADDLLQYIEQHRQVLPIVYAHYNRKSPLLFKQISKLYGDFLSARKFYTEAAAVFSLAELWLDTFEQYKLANDWAAALTILNAKLLDVVKDKHGMIAEICDDLIRVKRYKEAATIQQQHLNNYEEAIKTLLCGYHFRDAIFLTIKHKRQDIILHDIIPTIERYCLDLEGRIQENTRNFHQYKERLFKLRTAKLQKHNFLMDDDQQDNTDFDLYSDAGTVITTSTVKSTSSRSSTRSSKNRRKEERKKQDLREGGVYEDIALIRALHVLIEETFKMGTDVRELCLVLLELDLKKEGNYLHQLLIDIQREMKDNVKDIWPDPSSTSIIINNDDNFDVLDEKYKSPPSVNDFSWQLSLFTEDKTVNVT